MAPKIFEYENGRLMVTPAVYTQPELRAILDKYDMKAEPYLAYVDHHTNVASPYVNLPENEKDEVIIYDIITTLGDFDFHDPLIKPAMEKMKYLLTSTTKRYYESLKISIDKLSDYLRDQPITEGKDGNLTEIIRIHKEGANTIRNFKDIEKQVDEELRVKTRGNVEVGEY